MRTLRPRPFELAAYAIALLGPLAYTLVHELTPVPVKQCAQAASVERPRLRVLPVPVVMTVTPTEALEELDHDGPSYAGAGDPAGAFFFLRNGRLVLHTEAEPAWSKGGLRRTSDPYRVRRRINSSAFPESLARWSGKSIDLYGPRGAICVGTIGDLAIDTEYKGDLIDLGDDEKLDAQGRAEVWASGAPWVVAPIDAPAGCLETAIWARDSRLEAPEILRQGGGATEVFDRAWAEFRASEEFQEMAGEYSSYEDSPPEFTAEPVVSWEAFQASHRQQRAWRDAGNRVRLVSLDFGDFDSMCGEGYGWSASRLHPITESGGWPEGDPIHEREPTAVFDANGDGVLDLLWVDYEGSRLLGSGPLGEREALVVYEGCPC